MRRGVSPFVSTVLLVILAVSLAAIIAPWALNLATTTSNQTSVNTLNEITCRAAALDFDTSFAASGVNWSFSGNDTLDVKMVNTGTVNLYNFSLEILYNTSTLVLQELDINSTFQKTPASPLKPGRSAILKASFPSDINGTLKEVKVLNQPCPQIFVTQQV